MSHLNNNSMSQRSLIELGDVGGRALEVVSDKIQRLVVIRAGDDDLAQFDLVTRVNGRAVARLPMTDL